MPIPNFTPQEFAKNLAQQAMQVVPEDLTEEQKKYIVNKVYQFCTLAGDAINNDTNLNYDIDKASIVTQFIGEWTFHKSVDIIRGGVPHEHWDTVLQQVAFAVFEVAKHTQSKGMDQRQSASLIEQEVTACYEKAIRDLAQAGNISQDKVNEVLNCSNIDQMAQDPETINISKEEEERTLKFASVALLLLSLPPEKAERILANLPEEEAHQIRNYMKIPDLGQKLDPMLANEFLTTLNSRIMSMPKKQSVSDNYVNIIRNLSSSPPHEAFIKHAADFERSKIRDFINFCIKDNLPDEVQIPISPHIKKIVAGYIKHKVKVSFQS